MALGLTLSQFSALPDAEQDFWLAYQLRRQQQIDRLLTRLRDSEYVDSGALVATLLEKL